MKHINDNSTKGIKLFDRILFNLRKSYKPNNTFGSKNIAKAIEGFDFSDEPDKKKLLYLILSSVKKEENMSILSSKDFSTKFDKVIKNTTDKKTKQSLDEIRKGNFFKELSQFHKKKDPKEKKSNYDTFFDKEQEELNQANFQKSKKHLEQLDSEVKTFMNSFQGYMKDNKIILHDQKRHIVVKKGTELLKTYLKPTTHITIKRDPVIHLEQSPLHREQYPVYDIKKVFSCNKNLYYECDKSIITLSKEYEFDKEIEVKGNKTKATQCKIEFLCQDTDVIYQNKKYQFKKNDNNKIVITDDKEKEVSNKKLIKLITGVLNYKKIKDNIEYDEETHDIPNELGDSDNNKQIPEFKEISTKGDIDNKFLLKGDIDNKFPLTTILNAKIAPVSKKISLTSEKTLNSR